MGNNSKKMICTEKMCLSFLAYNADLTNIFYNLSRINLRFNKFNIKKLLLEILNMIILFI